jgi:hypothetical protein
MIYYFGSEAEDDNGQDEGSPKNYEYEQKLEVLRNIYIGSSQTGLLNS